MIRGIAIFAFFTLSTVLVIVLQPGPREDFAAERSDADLFETSRNEIQVLDKPAPQPALVAPDNVLSELKAGARTQANAPQTAVREAASNAIQHTTIDTNAAIEEVKTDLGFIAPQPAPAQMRQPLRTNLQPSARSVAPELRDMSWQTLNALNSIGHVAKAPGQEGSLLNSIVRRSMGHVDGAQNPQPRVATTFTAPRKAVAPAPRAAAQPAARAVVQPSANAANNSYIVSSGDTLALIAIKLYGSALAKDRLLSENPSLRQNPNALRIGQVLKYSMP